MYLEPADSVHMPAGPQEEQQEQQEQHQGPKVRCRLPCCVPACERRLHAAAAWLGWSGRVWVADAVMAMSDVVFALLPPSLTTLCPLCCCAQVHITAYTKDTPSG